MLTRTAHRTLTEQLADRFAERIRSRLLPAGARLPSVRDCARQQGVSPLYRGGRLRPVAGAGPDGERSAAASMCVIWHKICL